MDELHLRERDAKALAPTVPPGEPTWPLGSVGQGWGYTSSPGDRAPGPWWARSPRRQQGYCTKGSSLFAGISFHSLANNHFFFYVVCL